MKVIIKKQKNYKNDTEFSDEEEIEVEITKEDDEILIERQGTRLIIPLEAFIGIFS